MKQKKQSITDNVIKLSNRAEDLGDEYLSRKAPIKLSPYWRQAVVRIMPWAVLLLCVFIARNIFALYILTPAASNLAIVEKDLVDYIRLFLMSLALVVQIISLPYLFSTKKRGWHFLLAGFFATTIVHFMPINYSGLVGSAVGLLLLFQIKSYYR